MKPYLIREEVMSIDYTSYTMTSIQYVHSISHCMARGTTYTQYITLYGTWYDVSYSVHMCLMIQH